MENREALKEKIGVDGEWNWIFGGLETLLDLFVVFWAKVEVPMDETSFVHNAWTRRIDPRHPEGPRLHFFLRKLILPLCIF